jgi:hypothetical protein
MIKIKWEMEIGEVIYTDYITITDSKIEHSENNLFKVAMKFLIEQIGETLEKHTGKLGPIKTDIKARYAAIKETI